jgi:hypothetical protein
MERLSLRDALAGAGGGGGGDGGAATAAAPGLSAARSPPTGALAAALGRPTQPIALLPPAAVQHVRDAFGELLATSPSSLILSLGQGSVSRSVGGVGGAGGGGGPSSLSQAVAADEAAAACAPSGARFSTVQYEAAMWDAFAQVYSAEVEARLAAAAPPPAAAAAADGAARPLPMPLPLGARDAQLSVEDRRQILADILVWAEVTRPGYDAAAADFVTGPHASDAAFRRVGDALKAAKEERGLA